MYLTMVIKSTFSSFFHGVSHLYTTGSLLSVELIICKVLTLQISPLRPIRVCMTLFLKDKHEITFTKKNISIYYGLVRIISLKKKIILVLIA